MKYIDFRGTQISKIFKGNWQLAGGHGEISTEDAIQDLFAYVNESHINVLDTADIYGDSEVIIGKFLKEYEKTQNHDQLNKIRVHTKFVPDLEALTDISKNDVERIIRRSLDRLGLDRLHLVQFHWWDFSKGDFLKVGNYLQELKNSGLIDEIGVTNFDCEHLQMMLDQGIEVASNQIQFSMLDPRPLNGMLDFSIRNNISIFCYGTLAGGLLAQPSLQIDPENRSHKKYALMIEEAGMSHYLAAMELIGEMAQKYNTTRNVIANAFVLNTPGVSAAIIGPRNSNYTHEANKASELILEPEDMLNMTDLLMKSNVQGDIYSYERLVSSKHGKIMRYNLNHMRDEG